MNSGEITPATNTEFIMAIIIMLISSMILANLFGQMT